MDGLDEFEKALAEEKKAREKAEKHSNRDKDRERGKHRHRHKSTHERSRDHDRDDHRHKRSRHSRDREEEEDHRKNHKHAKISDPHEDLPIPDDEKPLSTPTVSRDSWMEAPSALDIDYTQKGVKKVVKAPPTKPDYDLKIHKNELNHHLQDLADGKKLEDIEDEHEVEYTFGDSGSQWRMTKLKAVYTQAEESGRSVEEIAIERFGSLREFDDAREEQIEVDRRQLHGEGYVGKDKPSGELFQERKMDLGIRRNHEQAHDTSDLPPQGTIMEEKPAPATTAVLDLTTLNRMKAQLMKAKLKNNPDVAQLEQQYNEAMANFSSYPSDPGVVVLGKMDNRMLAGIRGEVKAIDNKRGRERGLVEENEDMSIEDMVREERRTKGQAGGESMRAAERIAKDAKFDDDLDYMDDNANKLAKRVQKSEINLKNAAVGDFQKMNRILDSCQLCHHEDKNQPPIAPLISLATRVYLTLPTEPELSEGGAVIVPIQHRTNLLECDDDEWEEIRNFMKCLTRMYHDQGRDVVFYENAAAPHRKMHAAMQAVPLPYSLGETAPAFFKEAILSADEEWTQHRKLIDTAAQSRNGMGKSAFRRSLVKEMPYFHAWFDLDGGLGHIVEDSNRWPKGDLFAREIIGGMLDIEPDVIKRQGRWVRGDKRLEGFKARWRKFDWTRVLTDG
ncbi:uncharacterized protein LY89DRAFT_677279 [Mollisia scopiformis]|uniref:Cell cycle control protein cwf19 n=1 Tax=Mollisia scopiformis TaxID=149040 RepID=A0A132B6J4_MOLSC|nr:uncharacterized protein LY89DRAFT_677279 [Mollisia scopiformis]KUJ07951.1 hypothetical protein LY89DRAFT_677279 [Mollisia scopiformis]